MKCHHRFVQDQMDQPFATGVRPDSMRLVSARADHKGPIARHGSTARPHSMSKAGQDRPGASYRSKYKSVPCTASQYVTIDSAMTTGQNAARKHPFFATGLWA